MLALFGMRSLFLAKMTLRSAVPVAVATSVSQPNRSSRGSAWLASQAEKKGRDCE